MIFFQDTPVSIQRWGWKHLRGHNTSTYAISVIMIPCIQLVCFKYCLWWLCVLWIPKYKDLGKSKDLQTTPVSWLFTLYYLFFTFLGFADYSCGCAAGFTGSVCEEDIDECLSSPCPTNHTCVDQTNAYQCICQDGRSCSVAESEQRSTLDGWLVAVISAGAVLFVLLVIVAMFLVYKFCTATHDGIDGEPLFDNRGK